ANKEGEKPVELSGWMMWANLAFSVGVFLFMYKFIPLLLATKIGDVVPAVHGRLAINLMDGVIRMGILLLFLFGISLMKDMYRMFQYHGAEHKVVFNFESGEEVNVTNAQRYVTFHPRCGTSFLLVIMAISIPIYAFLPIDNFLLKFLVRVALL